MNSGIGTFPGSFTGGFGGIVLEGMIAETP
jgi:hypothetical protein